MAIEFHDIKHTVMIIIISIDRKGGKFARVCRAGLSQSAALFQLPLPLFLPLPPNSLSSLFLPLASFPLPNAK